MKKTTHKLEIALFALAVLIALGTAGTCVRNVTQAVQTIDGAQDAALAEYRGNQEGGRP